MNNNRIVITVLILIGVSIIVYFGLLSIRKDKERFYEVTGESDDKQKQAVCDISKTTTQRNFADFNYLLRYLKTKFKLPIGGVPAPSGPVLQDCPNLSENSITNQYTLIELIYMTLYGDSTTKPTVNDMHNNFIKLFDNEPDTSIFKDDCRQISKDIKNIYKNTSFVTAKILYNNNIRFDFPDRYKNSSFIPRNTTTNVIDTAIKYLAIGLVDKDTILLCALLNNLYEHKDGGSEYVANFIANKDNIQVSKLGTALNSAKLSLAKYKSPFETSPLFKKSRLKFKGVTDDIASIYAKYNEYFAMPENDAKYISDFPYDTRKILKSQQIDDSDLVNISGCLAVPPLLINANDCKKFDIVIGAEKQYIKSAKNECDMCDYPSSNSMCSVSDAPTLEKYRPKTCNSSSAPASSGTKITTSATRPTTTNTNTTTTTKKAANVSVSTGASISSPTVSTKSTDENTDPYTFGSSGTQYDAYGYPVTTTTKANTTSGSSGTATTTTKPNDTDWLNKIYGSAFSIDDVSGRGFTIATGDMLKTMGSSVNDIGKSLSGLTGSPDIDIGYAGFNPDEKMPISKYDNTAAAYNLGVSGSGYGYTNTGLGSGYPSSFSYSGGVGKHSSYIVQKDFDGVSNIFAPNIVFAGNETPGSMKSGVLSPRLVSGGNSTTTKPTTTKSAY
jgi:hypothetical protein